MDDVMNVKVYINRNPERFRRAGCRTEHDPCYVHGDPLELALEFEAQPIVTGQSDILERIFQELNRPEPHGLGTLTPEQIADYHRRFPSMSIGDVVMLDDRYGYFVDLIGFLRILPELNTDILATISPDELQRQLEAIEEELASILHIGRHHPLRGWAQGGSSRWKIDELEAKAEDLREQLARFG